MITVYLVMTVLFALMVALSGFGKVRRDPRQVKVLAAGALGVRVLTM